MGPFAVTFAPPCPLQPCPAPTGTTLDVVEVESYDPYTDTWTPVSPALKYVSNFSAASCQGRLYLVGSSACKYNALALQCYNPVTGGKPRGHGGPRGETRGHLHRATAPTRLAVRGAGAECPRAGDREAQPQIWDAGWLPYLPGTGLMGQERWPGPTRPSGSSSVSALWDRVWLQLGCLWLGGPSSPISHPLFCPLDSGHDTRTHFAGWV